VLGTVEGQEGDRASASPAAGWKLGTGLKNGSQFLPVFLAARMQDYVKTRANISVQRPRLADPTRGAPVTLNPASEYGRRWPEVRNS
jgi:hypothetical protein